MATGLNTSSLKNIFNRSSGETKVISGTDLISQEVKFLLGFQKYSLFFGNEMGLSPEKYLGLRNTLAKFNLIKSEIVNLFSKYNRARIENIEMTFDDRNSKVTIDLILVTSTYGRNTFNVSFDISN